MVAVIDICNRALGEIGTRSTIASLSENSEEARYCNIYYEAVRDQALGLANWNFARYTTTLAVLKAAPGTPENPDAPSSGVWSTDWPAPPWLYEYAFPSDCIRCRYIIPQLDMGTFNVPLTSAPVSASSYYNYQDPIKFVVATDKNADNDFIKVILTSQSQAILVYTAQVTDPNAWEPDFVQVVVNALAGKLTIPLTGDRGLAQLRIGLANQQALEARGNDGNEGLTVQESLPDWLRVRGFGDVGPSAALPPYASLFSVS